MDLSPSVEYPRPFGQTPGPCKVDKVPANYELRPQDERLASELGKACSVGPAIAQILIHRGFSSESDARGFLDPRLSGLTPPDGMADREAAVERLSHAVRNQERITVFGDYDVDGTTSAAILGGILEALGAQVTVLLANRFDGGYGLSDSAYHRVLETNPAVVVTCDCGSSDHERLDRLRQAGIAAIVVDHHLVPDEALPAVAFLNPHRPDCRFPYKGLASAGLALLLGAGVRTALRASLDIRSWLDLVALGTVADVAPLTGDNRRLVRAGLSRLTGSNVRPGIAALRDMVGFRAGQAASAVDIAFRFAPRLNAMGRLGDSSLTLKLLQEKSVENAQALAAEVERANEQRKTIERAVTAAAIAQVVEVYGARPRTGVVAAAEGWHRGVVGISAARLAEQFGRPAAVVALDGALGHGSCRTPDDHTNVHAALLACRDHLERFGGHRAAAGFTVRREKVEALRAAFADATSVEEASVVPPKRLVDVCVDGGVFRLPSARELALLEPMGEGNEEPLWLLSRARVERMSFVGEGRHLKLWVRAGGQNVSVFGYEMSDTRVSVGQTVDLVGHLRIDHYHGGDSVELRLSDVLA